ncbi:MAG: aspartate kinase [Clostridia bacterium]|nr:aspartate kinase [Clostridia bacterium]
MRFIVQKFGGTSVATPEKRQQVAQKIIGAQAEGFAPVVVVSAIGRTGDPYATDTLINLAREVHSDVPGRELDLLVACGEIISGVILVNTLIARGHPAVLLTGGQAGIITDGNFANARIEKIQPGKILEQAKAGNIVVVAGFQGVTRDGEVTTLGRGGSDTTAAALGVALDAEYIDIFTDVEGIMTADPRLVEDAQTIDVVTYNETCQLAHEGAKVIHPRAVEIAMQKNIPLRVKCTFSNEPGTLVTNQGELAEVTGIQSDRLITGIAHISGLSQIKIFTKNYPDIKDVQMKIFKALALADISVDFINIYPHLVIFTVRDEVGPKTVEILANMGFEAEIQKECAKIAAVGAGMTGIPGVMAGIIEALTKEGITILQSADSYTTIWCLVQNDDMAKAVRALHRQFGLNKA